MQDVWVRVLRGIGRLREPARLRAWLFGIARRALMDRLRVKYAEPAQEPVDPAELAAPDDGGGRDDEIELLHEGLARLPPIEREVLVLFYLHELSLNELADVLAIPVGTVKSRLFRARALLREGLTRKE